MPLPWSNSRRLPYGPICITESCANAGDNWVEFHGNNIRTALPQWTWNELNLQHERRVMEHSLGRIRKLAEINRKEQEKKIRIDQLGTNNITYVK